MYRLNKNKTFTMLTCLIPSWTLIALSIDYFGLKDSNIIDNLFFSSLILSQGLAITHNSDQNNCKPLKLLKTK